VITAWNRPVLLSAPVSGLCVIAMSYVLCNRKLIVFVYLVCLLIVVFVNAIIII